MGAQESTDLIGKLVNTNEEVQGVAIINLNTRKATVTDGSGKFQIEVTVGDTIAIRAIQFKPKRIRIAQEVVDKKQIDILMDVAVNGLDEIKLSNIFLTGEVLKDATGVVLDPKKINRNADSLNPIAIEYRRLHTATSRPSDQVGRQNLRLDISLDNILNALSGKTKRLKRAVAIMEYQKKVERIRNFYSDNIFLKSLNIPENLIDDFTYWVLQDKEEIKEVNLDNELITLDFLMSKWSAYTELKENEIFLPKN